MATIVYADKPETILQQNHSNSARPVNHLLMGTWLKVLRQDGAWVEVEPRPNRGRGGWVRKSHTRATPALKIFVVDVGQGDGAIVEAPNGRLLIDGGPSKSYYKFLQHRYWPLIKDGEKVHFDAVVVSHPDMDHFRGIVHGAVERQVPRRRVAMGNPGNQRRRGTGKYLFLIMEDIGRLFIINY